MEKYSNKYIETEEYIYPSGIDGEIVLIKCKKHSFLFETTLENHINNGCCPECLKRKSIFDNLFKSFIFKNTKCKQKTYPIQSAEKI